MKIHIVQKGDTMWSIAKKYGVSFDELRNLNGHIREPELAVPGMKLKIPTLVKPAAKEAAVRSEAGGNAPASPGQQTPAPTFHGNQVIQEDDMSAAPYPIMPQMPQITMPNQAGNALPAMPQQQAYVGPMPTQQLVQPHGQQMQGYPTYPEQQGAWQQPMQGGSWLIQQPHAGMPMHGGTGQHANWNMQGMQPGQQMQGDWNTQGMQPGQPMQGDWNMQGMQPGQQMQGDWNTQGMQPGQQMQGDWNTQGMQPGQQMQGDWNTQGMQPGQQMQGDWNMQGMQPGQQMQGDWNMQGMQPGQQMQGPQPNQAQPYSYPQTPMRSCCGPNIPFPAAPLYSEPQSPQGDFRDPYGVQPPLSDFYEPSPAQDLPGDDQDNK
ncbi:SafA/ExsA family spore coat assembly protein [Terribacillus saccharophilus]|uniref:LysM peptidoglycan-binding domain-containing protein n=1 Tax=Terribacillus saccharophilus TaxID=361277 RepID=UPI00398257A2